MRETQLMSLIHPASDRYQNNQTVKICQDLSGASHLAFFFLSKKNEDDWMFLQQKILL